MRNFVQTGEVLDLIAPYALTAGAGALIGSLFVVATAAAASGAAFSGRPAGVFDLTKATGAVTAGVKLYWDNTAKNVTTTSSANTLIGVATQAALSGDATVRVKLGIVA